MHEAVKVSLTGVLRDLEMGLQEGDDYAGMFLLLAYVSINALRETVGDERVTSLLRKVVNDLDSIGHFQMDSQERYSGNDLH
ncbi:MAG: hypothetical protein ACR2PT_15510 [Endozoicomonas sp.]